MDEKVRIREPLLWTKKYLKKKKAETRNIENDCRKGLLFFLNKFA